MGTICILFGLIIFLASIFLGFTASNWVWSTFAPSLVGVFKDQTQTYIGVVGVCGFIGLLICLNLVMHGLTYNKLNKLSRHNRYH